MLIPSGDGLVCDGSNLRGLILDATSREIKQSEEANAEAAETERGRMIDLSTVDVSMALRVPESLDQQLIVKKSSPRSNFT